MADIDIEKLAREAGVAYVDPETYVLCPSIREGCDMRPELRAFAALVLEEAARRCDDDDGCGYVPYHVPLVNMAEELRTIAEGLKK